ncbi:MAG TPA: M56 family metallopeptidase [Humisphaera sp.]|jgi:beta-lactamase regulating signal transducer with metallopeptidase domain|nr:M56 family metallopeptidase [Humisphaera sp.]
MNALLSLAGDSLVVRIDRVMLHFIWQGGIIAIALWAALASLRNAPSIVRYRASCCAMALLACAPLLTFLLQNRWPPVMARVSTAIRVSPSRDSIAEAPAVETTTAASAVQVRPWLALPVCLWMAGAACMCIWRIGGGVVLRRILKRATPAAGELSALADRLALRLKISQAVRLLESSRVRVPAVVGWIKPVILLPTSIVSGLSIQQIEAILAHELAHIQRLDYLVNLVQVLVEALLFFHPAVWWISSQVRQQREDCCDDVALAACGDRLEYARALARLEEMRGSPMPLALAASDGLLLRRIRRILGQPTAEIEVPRGGSVLILAAIIISLGALSAKSRAQDGPVSRPAATQATTQNVTQNATGVEPDDLRPNGAYRIYPNDVLWVRFEDSAGPATLTMNLAYLHVTESGNLALPYLSQRQAAGSNALHVEVVELEAYGRRFTVEAGDRSQNYALPAEVAFLLRDALIFAGIREIPQRIKVIRQIADGGTPRVIEISGADLASAEKRFNIVIRARDTIRVETAKINASAPPDRR